MLPATPEQPGRVGSATAPAVRLSAIWREPNHPGGAAPAAPAWGSLLLSIAFLPKMIHQG